MNKFKKIGLTALASSLVVSSAVAGEMSVSGGASIGLKNTSKTSSGKSWTMGNQLTFTGSGELDNGMTVSTSFVIDQADDSTTTTNARDPFDSHSVTVSSDSMGTLVFSGEGGSSANSAIDTTAAGDLWNNGSGIAGPIAPNAGDNSLFYTLPSVMDDVSITASYSPGRAGQDTATAFAIGYTGVEGLSLNVARGDKETIGSQAEITTMKASYAIGSITLGYSVNDAETDAAGGDEELTSMNIAYTVSDNMSVSYGVESFENEGSANDEEMEGFGVSYTTGGVTLSANQYNAENVGGIAGTAGEKERWALSASFAF
jgi:outer membrane protein OmpU